MSTCNSEQSSEEFRSSSGRGSGTGTISSSGRGKSRTSSSAVAHGAIVEFGFSVQKAVAVALVDIGRFTSAHCGKTEHSLCFRDEPDPEKIERWGPNERMHSGTEASDHVKKQLW